MAERREKIAASILQTTIAIFILLSLSLEKHHIDIVDLWKNWKHDERKDQIDPNHQRAMARMTFSKNELFWCPKKHKKYLEWDANHPIKREPREE